ncbi:MAG: FAD-dependent oxidoreductase [Deltaproteobacteria bacterium]|nr:FAD-dependent oxidoreductase [Deltaproteobacteria bacterium]
MPQTRYVIIGSSHAGLSAVEAIRLTDRDNPVFLLTQEDTLPYSPTILPYVVSGEADPEKIFLKDEDALKGSGVVYRRGEKVVGLDLHARSIILKSGEILDYDKLLLATGAAPVLPPVEGLEGVSCHVLRTLEDALGLRRAMEGSRSAVVLGGGLIGMHAAENLHKGGLKVTLVEALDQILPGYFDREAAGLIRDIFRENGIEVLTGSVVTRVFEDRGRCIVSLDSGEERTADLLLVATGVRPRIGFLTGSGIDAEEGVLVDERMRTTHPDVWAAGDVAQAPDFFDSGKKRIHATLVNAVEQGRIAGMDMAGDEALVPHPGGIAMNTYRFFGHRAFAVGLGGENSGELSPHHLVEKTGPRYRKIVLQGGRLVGASGINDGMDPGIIAELIRRKIPLQGLEERFISDPLGTGRVLMSRTWR